jgi:hypothetical protein
MKKRFSQRLKSLRLKIRFSIIVCHSDPPEAEKSRSSGCRTAANPAKTGYFAELKLNEVNVLNMTNVQVFLI